MPVYLAMAKIEQWPWREAAYCRSDDPTHGGFGGYGADADHHAWEIAWNPGPID
jgi:hypothetical protein